MDIAHQIQIGICFKNSIFMDEIDSSKNLFKYLITPLLDKTKVIYRGAHVSVVGEEYTVSVFYNALGWADVGYNYLKLIACNIKEDSSQIQRLIDERKTVNFWYLRG